MHDPSFHNAADPPTRCVHAPRCPSTPQNSSLVLTAEHRARDMHEPSGEPETLWGRLDGKKMGDRVRPSKPEGASEAKDKKKRDAVGDMDDGLPVKARRTAVGADALDLDTAAFYRPRTKETREAYEALLAVIQGQFGDQPADVLRGAADEVLATLKNDQLRDPERQKELGELLGPVPNERFAQLVAIGKLINDFSAEGEETVMADTMDEEVGVAVEFESEEEEDEEALRTVVDR